VELACAERTSAPSSARRGQEEKTMTEYLITFNDEWVPDHSGE
jgi:hypothetical protein